jgi:16S rRNA processing protein RimM
MMKRRLKVNENETQGTGSPQPGEPVFVAVGKLRRPHGVNGEMLMDVLTDFPQRLRKNKVVYVGEEHEALTLETVRPQDRALLVSFAGFEGIDAIGRLRNFNVYVKISELPPLPEGEYYHHQLIDLRVVDETGKQLGALTEILETGANDVYVVTDTEGKEILMPAIADVVLKVDLEKREIQVRPPDWS